MLEEKGEEKGGNRAMLLVLHAENIVFTYKIESYFGFYCGIVPSS